MTTMTYAQALEIAINSISNEIAIDKLTALKTQLEKRSISKTPTKTQKENEKIMAQILIDLEEFETPVTVSELIAGGEGMEGFSNQKISALLRKLVKEGKVTTVVEGRKTRFTLTKEEV